MPQTRGKHSKSKKLSLQRVLRSKDKTDKSSNMDTDTGYNNNWKFLQIFLLFYIFNKTK